MSRVALDDKMASRFANIALGHVGREYPHKLDHVMAGDSDARTPRQLHPIFFGSFDWHSCVHGWWTLLTLRRLFPNIPEAEEISTLANASFTNAKVASELAYLDRPLSAGFERPYGWGWLLYLRHEAERHADQDWAAQLDPLARAFARRFADYLPKLTYPITVGTHFNTAFALTQAHEWAVDRDAEFAGAIERWAEEKFAGLTDYRGLEPGGDEFLSPALSIALLMSRITGRSRFTPWFESFLLENETLETRFQPVFVSDRSDGKIAHLDGLNLSRAWALSTIARKIAPHPRVDVLDALAAKHLDAALPHVAGDYMGEHWLASFALLALMASANDSG